MTAQNGLSRLYAHALPDPALAPAFRSATVVIIDVLRASTTICAALASGASRVIPCLEPDDARRIHAALPAGSALLAGERHAAIIEGFDLGNSPGDFTPERVGGRDVVFTTTNGTRAALLAQEGGAAEIVVGCFHNIGALADHLAMAAVHRPLHLLCSGTAGGLSIEDCLFAGLLASRLTAANAFALADKFCSPPGDDAALLMMSAADDACRTPAALLHAVSSGRGGRNVAALGLHADIERCARIGGVAVVPRLDASAGGFVAAQRPV